MQMNPDISVVIVCFNEVHNITACLDSLFAMDYPKDKFEVIVVDNGSTDGTLEKLKEYADVRIVNNPVLSISRSRNIGIKEAKYDLVAFTDADCTVPVNWLTVFAMNYLKQKDFDPLLSAVGGSSRPPDGSGTFYSSLRIMLSSYLGSAGFIQGYEQEESQYVPHISTVNIMYVKRAVLEVGGFDESFGFISEDEDLNIRLGKKEFSMYYIAGCFVRHKLRENIREWSRNMMTYGKGKVWLAKKHPDSVDPLLAMPLFLVVSLAVLIIIKPLAALFLVFIYTALISAYSMFICTKIDFPELTIEVVELFIATHISYGVGEVYGIFLPIGKG